MDNLIKNTLEQLQDRFSKYGFNPMMKTIDEEGYSYQVLLFRQGALSKEYPEDVAMVMLYFLYHSRNHDSGTYEIVRLVGDYSLVVAPEYRLAVLQVINFLNAVIAQSGTFIMDSQGRAVFNSGAPITSDLGSRQIADIVEFVTRNSMVYLGFAYTALKDVSLGKMTAQQGIEMLNQQAQEVQKKK